MHNWGEITPIKWNYNPYSSTRRDPLGPSSQEVFQPWFTGGSASLSPHRWFLGHDVWICLYTCLSYTYAYIYIIIYIYIYICMPYNYCCYYYAMTIFLYGAAPNSPFTIAVLSRCNFSMIHEFSNESQARTYRDNLPWPTGETEWVVPPRKLTWQ